MLNTAFHAGSLHLLCWCTHQAAYLYAKKQLHAVQLYFLLAGSAFGPDYKHFKGTAFGFYVDGFGAMSESGRPIEPATTVANAACCVRSAWLTRV